MSIYPVKLSEWFPLGDELHDIAFFYSKQRCYACGKKLRWKSVIGHHSIPWGNGDVWCSWKCCYSDKVAKIDRRREKRLKRKTKGLDYIVLENHEKK